MPKRSGKPRARRPTDLNELAVSVVAQATGQKEREPREPEQEKDPAAVALGRKGGLKGGKARAKKLSARRRKEIARRAARARWSKKS